MRTSEFDHGLAEKGIPMTMESMEQKYYEITELYDLAQELIDTVESEFVQDKTEQLVLVQPLVEQLGDSADVLGEEFISLMEQPKNRNNPKKVEAALRKIYMAVQAYQERATKQASQTATAFRNVADPIIKKIKRQMEAIVAVFITIVDLSLDRIMQKTEIEELKQRQSQIALMLHSLGQQQGT